MNVLETKKRFDQRDKVQFEKETFNKIDLYRMHGIEPTKVKSVGTDFYKNFMDEKIKERDEVLIKQFNEKRKVKDKIPMADNIANELNRLQGKSEYEAGKKYFEKIKNG